MAIFSFVALKTLFLIVVWISMGLSIEVFGPTLKDLKAIFRTDYESISRAIGARGIGGCLGAVVAGVLADRFPRCLDLMMTIYTTEVSVCIALISTLQDTDQMWFLCLAFGVGVGAVNIVGQRLILVMWKERSASPTHALHMGFGIGALLIPLIANPFLMVTQPPDSNNTSTELLGSSNTSNVSTTLSTTASTIADSVIVNSTSNTSFVDQFFSTNITMEGNDLLILSASRVSYVFILVGCITFISGLPFIVYQCFNSERCNPIYRKITESEVRHTEKISFLEMLNPASYTGGSMGFGLIMFTLIFIFYTGAVGGEQLFGTFIRTYSVDLLNFSKDDASYLLMVYWIAFTFSRFLGSVLSHIFKVKYIIIVQAVFNLASVTTMNLVRKTSANMWIFTGVQGMLCAPLYPLGISFINTVMDVRGFCLTVVSLSAGLGDLGYIWIAGKLYDHFGPYGIMYAMQASGISIMIAVFGFCFASRRRKSVDGRLFHTAAEKLEMSVNSTKHTEETAGLLETSEDEL